MAPETEAVLREEIQFLHNQLDWLRDENEVLRTALLPPIITPPLWRLTPGERKFLSALRAAHPQPLTRERGMAALYGGSDTAPAHRILNVYVCNIRRKLRAVGLACTIRGVYGMGWVLTDVEGYDAALAAFARETEETHDAPPQAA